MAPSSSTDLTSANPTSSGLGREEQKRLLAIARAAIADESHDSSRIELASLPADLQRERAAFVTLTINGALRGCIGSLVASAPLALAVADAAHGAARRDPRFPALRTEELETIRIEISILSELERIAADSRQALLAALRPMVDGLLLEDGRHRSTFLPKVWEQLPEPQVFLTHLLAKAGLPPDHWSATMRAHRYTTMSLADGDI